MLIKMINENDILALTRTHTYTHRTHGQDTSNYHFHSDPKQSETIITNSHCQNTYMQHAHYTHTCVNKVYSKCFGIFAYVHEPVCMRCIQNYSVDSFVSTAANKLCWILGFGWMLFFPFCEPVWPHKFVKRIQRNVFPFCPSCLFLLLWVSCN